MALVFTQKLKANQNYLVSEENKIEKYKLDLHSINNLNNDFILLDSEEELNKYLNERKENVKIKTDRIKIPRVRFEKAFYPFDEELISKFKNENFDLSKKENIDKAKKLIEKEGTTLNISNKKIKIIYKV